MPEAIWGTGRSASEEHGITVTATLHCAPALRPIFPRSAVELVQSVAGAADAPSLEDPESPRPAKLTSPTTVTLTDPVAGMLGRSPDMVSFKTYAKALTMLTPNAVAFASPGGPGVHAAEVTTSMAVGGVTPAPHFACSALEDTQVVASVCVPDIRPAHDPVAACVEATTVTDTVPVTLDRPAARKSYEIARAVVKANCANDTTSPSKGPPCGEASHAAAAKNRVRMALLDIHTVVAAAERPTRVLGESSRDGATVVPLTPPISVTEVAPVKIAFCGRRIVIAAVTPPLAPMTGANDRAL